jgi:hypothetical protein
MSEIAEIDLDPLGYIPRPDLYVRNLSPQTINFSEGQVKFSLPPWPSEDYEQPLPWTVARAAGFERLWERGQVLVALDADFNETISELPEHGITPGSTALVVTQGTPQAVTEVTHNLHRHGPVHVTVYSLDFQTEYFNFTTDLINDNVCRIGFDDPIAFVATIS